MSVTPKCPHCGSVALPEHVRQEYDVTTVLLLYCATCGSILGAADYSPHYPDTRVHHGRGTTTDS